VSGERNRFLDKEAKKLAKYNRCVQHPEMLNGSVGGGELYTFLIIKGECWGSREAKSPQPR